MTPSRLIFEVTEASAAGFSGAADRPKPAQLNLNRRPPELLRSTLIAPGFHPGELTELAEGLEGLHRQVDDWESESVRSRDHGATSELEVRRGQLEAAKLRVESEQLRDALAKTHDEILGMRAERAKLENLASEQQRALVLSLELLKTVNRDALVVEGANDDVTVSELNLRLEAASEDADRAESELKGMRLQLDARNKAWETTQREVCELREIVRQAEAGNDVQKAELRGALDDRLAVRSELESVRQELILAQQRTNNGPTALTAAAETARLMQRVQDAEAEIALQNGELESRGAIIVALEYALEEQNGSLRTLEERFLAYAEQVQMLQLQRLHMPAHNVMEIISKLAGIFSPPARNGKK